MPLGLWDCSSNRGPRGIYQYLIDIPGRKCTHVRWRVDGGVYGQAVFVYGQALNVYGQAGFVLEVTVL
jgi:hypothetical protein